MGKIKQARGTTCTDVCSRDDERNIINLCVSLGKVGYLFMLGNLIRTSLVMLIVQKRKKRKGFGMTTTGVSQRGGGVEYFETFSPCPCVARMYSLVDCYVLRV